jgi:galactoside O-acetyltransferase
MPAIEYAGGALELGSVGADVTLHPHCVFVAAERLHLGSHVIVSELTWIHAGIRTVVGSFVHLANHTSIAGGGFCLLEDFVGFSAGARVVTGTELVKGEGLTNPTIPADFRAVRRSFVHLARDVEPWTIVHGVPARPVGTRPSASVRELADRCYERLGIGPLDPTPHLALEKETLQLPRA